MLISMPTGTSTIFGVFQVIRVLPSKFGAKFAPRAEARTAPATAQAVSTAADFAAGHAGLTNGPAMSDRIRTSQESPTLFSQAFSRCAHPTDEPSNPGTPAESCPGEKSQFFSCAQGRSCAQLAPQLI
jgi:hypothetical protein